MGTTLFKSFPCWLQFIFFANPFVKISETIGFFNLPYVTSLDFNNCWLRIELIGFVTSEVGFV